MNKRRFDLCIDLFETYLGKNLGSSSVVGGFACGTANIGIGLAEKGYHVDLVENESKFFEYIKLKTSAKNIKFITADASKYLEEERYTGLFFGEALEQMARPDEVLETLYKNLRPGGILILTTPNGSFVNCYEPSWAEVQDKHERNNKLANTFGNHVCEFTPRELNELVKMAGFCILEHRYTQSHQVCRSSLMRRLLPQKLLWKIDEKFGRKIDKSTGKMWGMNQILVLQRARS